MGVQFAYPDVFRLYCMIGIRPLSKKRTLSCRQQNYTEFPNTKTKYQRNLKYTFKFLSFSSQTKVG